MTRRYPYVPLLLLLLLLPGCATSPIEQVIQGRQAYTVVLSGLNSAHRLGYLSTEDKVAIEPYRKAAATALDDMEREALAGGTNNVFSPFTAAAKAFRTALLELAKAQAKADSNKRAVELHAATRPVNHD